MFAFKGGNAARCPCCLLLPNYFDHSFSLQKNVFGFEGKLPLDGRNVNGLITFGGSRVEPDFLGELLSKYETDVNHGLELHFVSTNPVSTAPPLSVSADSNNSQQSEQENPMWPSTQVVPTVQGNYSAMLSYE